MEINKEVYIEQDTVGIFKEITSSIRAEDLGMALDAVSKNLYSNPIGSFVRELVSNGVDANRANNSAELVKVNIYKEGNTWYFQVKDEGKGMTPEHFTNVYMRWFNSDKRDNNEDIGGWGIGSKSPLSYKESYELTTVADGYEYEYIIVRQSPAPTATLLVERPTNKKSGTTVRIEIDEKDLFKLYQECKKQLIYFNNVYIINEEYYYENNFQIIEADLFKVRTDSFPYGNEMHIVLGQVSYPINWNFLGVSPIYIPVGLKFNIGELPVTLSREEINYSDDTVKETLLNKIETVYDDLYQRYSNQHKYTDLFEYMNFYYSGNRNLKLTDDVSIPFNIRDNGRLRPSLIVDGKAYKISKDVIAYIFNLFNVSLLQNTKLTHGDSSDFYFSRFLDNPANCLYRENDFNHWSNLYYGYGSYSIISKKKLSKKNFKDIANILNLTYIKPTPRGLKEHLKSGAAIEVHKFISFVYKSFKEKLKRYDNIPKDFINNKKEEQKLLEEERKGNITTYNILNVKENLKLEDLLTKYKYVFYINKNDDRLRTVHYSLLFEYMNTWFKSQYKLIIISDTTIKKLKKFNNVKTVENVWRVANLYNYFNNIRYSYELYALALNNLSLEKVSKYYNSLYNIVKKDYISFPYSKEYRDFRDVNGSIEYYNRTTDIDIYSYFKPYIDKITKKRNYQKEQALKELKKVSSCLYVLSTFNCNYKVDRLKIKHLIKEHKLTKLNPNYYG